MATANLTEYPFKPRAFLSPLERARTIAHIPLPSVLAVGPQNINFENNEAGGAAADHAEIQNAFPTTYGRNRITLMPSTVSDLKPIKVACVLSGGQASGGHNVVIGIYDYCKRYHKDSVVIGNKITKYKTKLYYALYLYYTYTIP